MTKPNSSEMSGFKTTRAISTIVLLITFISLAAVQAQSGSADFSGTWAFNESKSSPSQGNFRMAPGKLVITHNGINLAVERTSSGPNGDIVSNDKFTTDGNECVNTLFGNNTRKSTVKWSPDGKSLLFSHYMKFEMQGETREMTTSETWKLNDPSTLSVETSFNGPNGEVKNTNVYDKK